MMRISKIRSFLYRLARLLGDLSAIMSGNPKKVGRRIYNRAVGRAMSRVTRRLFK